MELCYFCASQLTRLMKRFLLFALVLLVSSGAYAQLPQFLSADYAGWVYSNPAIALNQSNIVNNRIVLYRTSTGEDLTLTSPLFAPQPGQTIDMMVYWITDQWQNESFVVSKVALTAALLDKDGVAVDSVTYNPVSVSRTNHVALSITVPDGMTEARIRFASWKADVYSSGAVRQINMSSSLRGDVNLDGEVTVADVNAVIGVILGGAVDDALRRRADVNRDSEVTLADVNAVIDIIVA